MNHGDQPLWLPVALQGLLEPDAVNAARPVLKCGAAMRRTYPTDRNRIRRAEEPPARLRIHPALQGARADLPGDLRPSHRLPGAVRAGDPRRRTGRDRSRPDLLHRHGGARPAEGRQPSRNGRDHAGRHPPGGVTEILAALLPTRRNRQCQRIKKPIKNTFEVRKRDQPRTPSNVHYALRVTRHATRPAETP